MKNVYWHILKASITWYIWKINVYYHYVYLDTVWKQKQDAIINKSSNVHAPRTELTKMLYWYYRLGYSANLVVTRRNPVPMERPGTILNGIRDVNVSAAGVHGAGLRSRGMSQYFVGLGRTGSLCRYFLGISPDGFGISPSASAWTGTVFIVSTGPRDRPKPREMPR